MTKPDDAQQRTPLSELKVNPAAGTWLLTRHGQLVQVVGNASSMSTQLPCRTGADAEPQLYGRGMLLWPPVAEPTAAAPSGASPARLHTSATAAKPREHTTTGLAAEDRDKFKADRASALARATELAEEIAAVQARAKANGRALPASTAVALAKLEIARRRR